MAQKPTVERYLPVLSGGAGEVSLGQSEVSTDAPNPAILIVKPSPQEVLEELLKKHFSLQTFRVFLESQASEHGARMTAMESATRNAGEVVKKLTLQYNKQRQAGITKELLEIVSGSEAQKAS